MQFIDLSLPSRTLWADANSKPCTNSGMPKKHIPTSEQWNELFRHCEQETIETENGPALRLTGKNGNSIVLPLEGYMIPVYNSNPTDEEKDKPRLFHCEKYGKGFYCTCDRKDWSRIIFSFYEDRYDSHASENTYKFSVRTIKNPK